MARKKRVYSRHHLVDARFQDLVVAKFINTLMEGGKKTISEKIFYDSLDLVQEKKNEVGYEVFQKAMENVKPALEVKSRRVGGATYQVPFEVRPERRTSLAARWLIDSARVRSEHSMIEKLANEILDASEGRGGAIKKREEVHKLAEVNRAFAHFRW